MLSGVLVASRATGDWEVNLSLVEFHGASLLQLPPNVAQSGRPDVAAVPIHRGRAAMAPVVSSGAQGTGRGRSRPPQESVGSV